MEILNYYRKILLIIIFYDKTYDDNRPKSLISSDLPLIRLILKSLNLFIAFPLSLLVYAILRVISLRYKVSIYVLKTFRPSFASTYLLMMEPLCRQLQHENDPRHIKILVDPGASVSHVLIKSYEPHFTLYLDDRRKFIRLIAYLIPKSGLEKKIINTSDKYLASWLQPPSKNYANLTNQIPSDLAKMGLGNGNFVLFAHPSQKYYESKNLLQNRSELQHRFYDLSTYELALTKLIENNLKVVRIGLQVVELPKALKALPIIDYAGQNRNEDSELWLYENCKFLLSASNGAFWFAHRFDRPSIITNCYGWPFGYFSTLITLMIMRSTKTGNLLSFAEMLELRQKPNFLSYQFMKDNHLELVPNSAATIANAVTDLLELVNDQYKSTPEDVKLMKLCEAMLTSFNIPIVEKMTVPAISFLREYKNLF